MYKKLPILYLFSVLCLSCDTLHPPERFLPEQCFEGNFLPVVKAIYANDQAEIVRQFKEQQITIDSVGQGGETGKPTLLLYAVFLQKPEMVAALLKMGADPQKVSLVATRKKKIDLKTGEEIFYYFQNPLNYASGYIKDIPITKK